MRQERISENKVRFILDQQDLEERNLEIAELSYGSPGAKELFDELMELAREEMGLDEGAHPMMVEAIPMPESGLVVNISRVENPEELDPRFSRFTNGIEFDRGPDGEEDEDGPPMIDDEDGPEGPIPDGVQIQQGPEIRAESNIPRSGSIDPKDIMNVIDNIMSGLAGKLGGTGGVVKKQPDTPSKKPEPDASSVDPFVIYEFQDLRSVVHAAQLLAPGYDSESILYKNPVNRRYYLYLAREHNTLQEFAGAIALLNEFGNRCRITYASKEFFEEHMEKILDDALLRLYSLNA